MPSLRSPACLTTLACAISLAIAPGARAQEATPPAPPAARTASELDRVVVTGRSGVKSRTAAEASYSITRIDEDALRLQAPTSVTEAMKSVPGFWVEASGGEASGNIRARGIPVDGFGSVTVLEDGVPVQHDPALGYLNGDQAFRLDETIERIEVVRGGPSSVFYSNAPAGAINFVPRPVGAQASGVLKLTVGDTGLFRYEGWLGTPLGDGWTLGLGGFARIDKGARDPGFQGNAGGQFRATLGKTLEHGHISFDLKRLDDRVALYLGIPMRTYDDGKIRAVPGFDGNHGTMAGPETARVLMRTGTGGLYDFDNTLGTEVKRTQFTVKFDHELGAGFKIANALRWSDTQTQRNGMFPLNIQSATAFLTAQKALIAQVPGATALQLRYANAPGGTFDLANQNGNGLLVVGGLRGVTMPLKELDNDLRLMRRFEFGTQSHDVTLGWYRSQFKQGFSRYSSNMLLDVQNHARVLDLVAVNAAGTPLATFTDHGIYKYGYEWENASGRSVTDAFYLADEWQITDALRIDGGLRWEKVHTRGWAEVRKTVSLGTPSTSSILTGSGVLVNYDEASSKSGWTLGANWQFNKHSGLFARWTSAFRLPNLSSYITRNTGCAVATLAQCMAANTKPITQTMTLGEIGFKYASPQFDLYATAFYTKYDNVGFSNYVFDVNTGTSTNQQGYASTRTTGLELEAAWYPVNWFDIGLTATLQNPEYKDLSYYEKGATGPVLRNFIGNQLIRVPKTSFRVVPGFNLMDGKLRLQASYEHEGQRFVDTANSVRLPAYNVINLTGRMQFTPEWTLFGYVDNVTNSLGLTEGNPRAGELQSADAGANTFLARPVLGRTYRLAAMYQF